MPRKNGLKNNSPLVFIFLIYLLIGFLVYGASLFNGFVWDDEEQVVNNVYIRELKNIPLLFSQSTFNTGGAVGLSGNYYKPLLPAAYTLLYQIFGVQPWGYHLFQVLLHTLNSFLIFVIFRSWFANKLAFLLSMLFLLHPLNTEAVVYISALQEPLFMFFGLSAFVLLLKTPERSVYKDLLIVSLTLASLLSKETGILWYVLLPLYVFFYQKKGFRQFLMVNSLGLFIYLLLRFGLAEVGIGVSQNSPIPIQNAPFWQRALTMPKSIVYYLTRTVFPKNLAIAQHWVVTKVSFWNFYLPLFILVILLFLAAAVFLSLKESKYLFLFLLFATVFISALVLHSNILIPLDMTVAERWFYLPLFALLGLMGSYLQDKRAIENCKKLTIVITIFIAVLGTRSFLRVLNWKDGLTLFTHDAKYSSGFFDFENNYGVYLSRAGREREAEKHFLASIKTAPKWWTNWNNLGVMFERKNQLKKAASYYLKAIDNGNYYLAYENYAGVLIKQKKLLQAKNFLEKQALARFPYNQRLVQMYIYTLQQLKTKN